MGCRVCRARKVKCDGRPNGCRNCERLQLECVSDNGLKANGNSSSQHLMSLRKIRTYRSCQTCRLSKTKCNGDRPKCSRCSAKLIDCVYDGGSMPRWTRNLKTSLSDSYTGDGDDDDNSQRPTKQVDTPTTKESGGDRNNSCQTEPHITSDESMEKQSVFVEAGALSVAGSGFQNDSTNTEPVSHPLIWLLCPVLPTGRNLRRVVEHYFSNVHPLRCFAFVHKPSFMRQLERGFTSDDELALLHIICAQGAKFLYLSAAEGDFTDPPPQMSEAGNIWAKRAENMLLANFGKISVQRLMTAILLHDFYFRLGEYGQSLMLSGFAVRMAHALKINSEYNSDILCTEADRNSLSVASRESRRRLMWACYVLDAWAGRGADQLTLLRENDIKIQLPGNERNFGLRIPSVTETLGVGHVLQFLPPAIVPRRPAANMGIMAYYIRVVALWKRIVRYVNHLHDGPPPWQPDSLFAALDADLTLWRRELPDFVEYTADTIYARLDSNQLGSLVLIHCTYHHNYLELYKAIMPDLFKLSKPFSFPPDQQEFLKAAQANCFYHAKQLANILAEAAEHGARLLSDSLLPFFVYDSSRVMLYYVACLLDYSRNDAEVKIQDALTGVRSNRKVIRMMCTLFPMAESLAATIDRWLSKIQQPVGDDDVLTNLESNGQVKHQPPAKSSEMNDSRIGRSEIVLPPLHFLPPRRSTPSCGTRDEVDGETESWSMRNPHAGTPQSWDGTSATAHQLLRLSREASARPSLHHERPVSTHGLRKPSLSICDALALDDLQSPFSWDMYGIMEIDGPVSNEDIDGTVSQSWMDTI